jgi:hypothetical protein
MYVKINAAQCNVRTLLLVTVFLTITVFTTTLKMEAVYSSRMKVQSHEITKEGGQLCPQQ